MAVALLRLGTADITDDTAYLDDQHDPGCVCYDPVAPSVVSRERRAQPNLSHDTCLDNCPT